MTGWLWALAAGLWVAVGVIVVREHLRGHGLRDRIGAYTGALSETGWPSAGLAGPLGTDAPPVSLNALSTRENNDAPARPARQRADASSTRGA